ncbi:MAG: cation:dicarboxylase symporter family transporter [candidate division Zixibacteria bacterium]|nr:cation:dicarboxylase symporter family transporter [candidate division Zixibacteria bacterium]
MQNKSGHSNITLYLILAAIVLGFILGHYYPYTALELKFLGDIFLNALFMLVVPLVVASMITGITRLGRIAKLGTLGIKTLFYYLTTTGISVIIGIVLVNILQPGTGVTREQDYHPDSPYAIHATPLRGGSELRLIGEGDNFYATDYTSKFIIVLLDQNVKGIIDDKAKATDRRIPIEYWVDAEGRKVEPDVSGRGVQVRLADKEFSFIDVLIGLIPKNIFGAAVNNNILPLIVFSLIFGAILTSLGEKGVPVVQLFEGLNEAFMKFIQILMYFAPLGILGLVAARLGQAELTLEGGFLTEVTRMAKYFSTVIIGLLIHAVFVLAPILFIFGRRSVLPYLANVSPALLTAFSTASSSATLPVTLESVEKKNKVSNRTAGFVLPLGATINMDGTALYEAVAAIFIAQVYNVPLGFGEQVIIFLTATLAAIGAAGIPEAGLVTMVIVLKAVGLPTEGIAMILAIDWFLDRCRTTVNVWGDSVGAAVIDVWERNGNVRGTK